MRAILCFLAAVAIGCSGTGPKTTGRVTKLLGGTDSVAAIRDAGITAYRIDGMGWGEGPGKRLHGYPVLQGPVDADDTIRAELASVLLDDDTYEWEMEKACEFLPGVLLRYASTPPVDVLLCFSCDELEVYVGARKVGREDFDVRRPDLVRVAQRLFPDDPAIRALKAID